MSFIGRSSVPRPLLSSIQSSPCLLQTLHPFSLLRSYSVRSPDAWRSLPAYKDPRCPNDLGLPRWPPRF